MALEDMTSIFQPQETKIGNGLAEGKGLESVTNAGSEQPYLSTWKVDSASVASGKVILAFFRSDSVNSDYSVSITVKYHLT